MIEISKACIGCGFCVKGCPFGAIELENKMARVNDKCTFCGACVQVCPVKCIKINRSERSADLSAYKGVWVFCETDAGGHIKSVSQELLGAAAGLAAELKEECCAVLPAVNAGDMASSLGGYGAQKVYVVEGGEYADYNTDIYSAALTALIEKRKPSIVLFPATVKGRDLAPRIAAELRVGLTADCTGLSIKNGNLLQTRPAFGGNIMADILSPNARPQMATVRPNVFKAVPRAGAAAPCVEKENIRISPSIARVVMRKRNISPETAGQNIADARIIVSGGRGAGKEGFKLIEELAAVLGGCVGASRAAVDMGLRPHCCQVGQSGTTVSPRLYIACGISGAIQHIVGMKSAEIIIAINKDPAAPIFNAAKYGFVGDLREVIPRLIKEIGAAVK